MATTLPCFPAFPTGPWKPSTSPDTGVTSDPRGPPGPKRTAQWPIAGCCCLTLELCLCPSCPAPWHHHLLQPERNLAPAHHHTPALQAPLSKTETEKVKRRLKPRQMKPHFQPCRDLSQAWFGRVGTDRLHGFALGHTEGNTHTPASAFQLPSKQPCRMGSRDALERAQPTSDLPKTRAEPT